MMKWIIKYSLFLLFSPNLFAESLSSKSPLKPTEFSQAKAIENLKLLALCKDPNCVVSQFSSDTSRIEMLRINEELKTYKIDESKKWTPCQLKMIELKSHEICFEIQDSEATQTQIFFSFEYKKWKLKYFRHFYKD